MCFRRRQAIASGRSLLRRDAAALKAAREAYATLAPKSMRLQCIDGFVACPRETYVKAVHCRREIDTRPGGAAPGPEHFRR